MYSSILTKDTLPLQEDNRSMRSDLIEECQRIQRTVHNNYFDPCEWLCESQDALVQESDSMSVRQNVVPALEPTGAVRRLPPLPW